MADREKLFDLMMRDPCPSPVICNPNCKYYKSHHCHAERYADHLIANGVTVRERGRWETTEVTEEWETVERFHHFHRECKYSYCDNGLGGHYFCPNCGADMRGEEDGK